MFQIAFLVLQIVLVAALTIARAYVVPTGAMAPTVIGYHKEVICPKCKSRVVVNASMEEDPPRPEARETVSGCTCTNCGRVIDFKKDKLSPSLLGGDRILSVKTSEATLPRHIVVTHIFPLTWFAPEKEKEKRIYVSRLVGLPGETLAFHGGRIYRSTELKFDDGKVKREEIWNKEHMHVNDPRTVKLFKDGKFEIVRKTPDLLLVLRRLVHNHDFPASDLPPRWSAGKQSAWKSDDSHGFRHEGQGDGMDWVSYRHLLRAKDSRQPRPHLVMDEMDFNLPRYGELEFFPFPNPNWVRDLLLECQVTVAKAEGEMSLELGCASDRFQARFDLATGRCRLFRLSGDGKSQELAVKETTLNKAGTYRVRFANCEDRLTLWIDEQLVFADGVTYVPAPLKGPTAADFEPARIGSRGAKIQVHHLQLWRDTYYSLEPGDADFGRADLFDGAVPDTWGPLASLPVRTFYVQPGHYFAANDNSQMSSDSRDYGVIPRDLVTGKVLFRYFPLQRVGAIR